MLQDVTGAPDAEVRDLIRTASRNRVKADRIDARLAAARATVALGAASEVRPPEIVDLLARWWLARRQKDTA